MIALIDRDFLLHTEIQLQIQAESLNAELGLGT